MDDATPLHAATEAGQPSCELVLLTGRMAGARRAVSGPLTLVGRLTECDLRLNADGVSALHCGIVLGAEEVTVRALGNDADTMVNDEPVTCEILRQGDILRVGPFQFRVEVSYRTRYERELDALRIQAAAVAAQQAELTEEELRLEHHRLALEQQERQLAAHLEQRQRDLDHLQQRLDVEQKSVAASRASVQQDLETLERAQAANLAERQRLARLWERFKRSWHNKCRDKEADIERRAQQLNVEQQQLQADRAAWQHELATFRERVLRFNGKSELERRQLQHGWEELGAAQRQWEEAHEREETALAQKQAQLEARAATVAAADKALEQGRQQWARNLVSLAREREGLEARVQNLRGQVDRLERDRNALRPATAEDVACVPSKGLQDIPGHKRADPTTAPVILARLAGDLTDQRCRLLEQWTRMINVHESWVEDRRRLMAEVESAERELRQRIDELAHRRREFTHAQATLLQEQDRLAEQRGRLDAWQSALTLRETAWEAERVRVLAAATRGEEIAEAMRTDLEQLREQWVEERRAEMERLGETKARHTMLRRHFLALWRTCQKERASLAQERRQLATQTLALERWRQEMLARTDNTPAAEKKLERMTLQEENLRADAEEDLRRKERALRKECINLDRRADALDRLEATLVAREDELTRRLTEFDLRRVAQADGERRHDEELDQALRALDHDERQLEALRAEIERIANSLLAGPLLPPAVNDAA